MRLPFLILLICTPAFAPPNGTLYTLMGMVAASSMVGPFPEQISAPAAPDPATAPLPTTSEGVPGPERPSRPTGESGPRVTDEEIDRADRTDRPSRERGEQPPRLPEPMPGTRPERRDTVGSGNPSEQGGPVSKQTAVNRERANPSLRADPLGMLPSKVLENFSPEVQEQARRLLRQEAERRPAEQRLVRGTVDRLNDEGFFEPRESKHARPQTQEEEVAAAEESNSPARKAFDLSALFDSLVTDFARAAEAGDDAQARRIAIRIRTEFDSGGELAKGLDEFIALAPEKEGSRASAVANSRPAVSVARAGSNLFTDLNAKAAKQPAESGAAAAAGPTYGARSLGIDLPRFPGEGRGIAKAGKVDMAIRAPTGRKDLKGILERLRASQAAIAAERGPIGRPDARRLANHDEEEDTSRTRRVILRLKPLEKRQRLLASVGNPPASRWPVKRMAAVVDYARPWAPSFAWLLVLAFFAYRVYRAIKRRREVSP